MPLASITNALKHRHQYPFRVFVTSTFLTYAHTHFLITSHSIKKHEKRIAQSPREDAT
jgi:hypothetical protein